MTMALKAVGSPAVEYKVSGVTPTGPPLGHCRGEDPNLPQQRVGRPEPGLHVAVIPGAAAPSWAPLSQPPNLPGGWGRWPPRAQETGRGQASLPGTRFQSQARFQKLARMET